MCLFIPAKPKRRSKSKKDASSSTHSNDPPATRPAEYAIYQSPTLTVPVPMSFRNRLPESYWDDAQMSYAYVNDMLWQSVSGLSPSSRKPQAVDILTEKIETHQELTKNNGEVLEKGLSGVSKLLDKIEGNLKAAIKVTDDNVKLVLDAAVKGTDATIQAVKTSSQEEKDRRAAEQVYRQQKQREAKLEETQEEVLRLKGMLEDGQARNVLLELDEIKKRLEECRQTSSSTAPEQPFVKLLNRLEDLVAELQQQGLRANHFTDEEQRRWQSGCRHQVDSISRDSCHRQGCDFLPSYHYHYHGADEESDWHRGAPPFFGHYPSRRQCHSAR